MSKLRDKATAEGQRKEARPDRPVEKMERRRLTQSVNKLKKEAIREPGVKTEINKVESVDKEYSKAKE